MDAISNKQVIAEIYEALAQGNSSVFADKCHSEYVWRLPGHSSWSRRFEGQAAVRRDLIAPLFSLFGTAYKAHVISLIAEGDRVVAEVRGDVMTKTGQRYNNEYCFIFKFEEGKIVEVVEYGDTDLEERVLGNYDEALAKYRLECA